ncbi:integrase catalytic domain-containing protein [Trichonephila clavata]|uniref:Integrase catalytic domain-containing protein n=1 Tax=Trichonephila clavata TaxID=2740835 RepID=A0A8X6FEH4_TRICU|nr:integrase catalytic domain-containing protein [Trichonephila clavata]
MFLREIPKSGVPDVDLVDREKLSKRAKYIQSIRDQLGKRFRSDNLGQLRHQSVKNYQIKPLKVAEIVLLEDVNKKLTFWDLARVEKLIPGRDGQTRLAVKTANSEFLRPVQRLFRLEMDSPVLSVADDSASVVTRSGRLERKVVILVDRLKPYFMEIEDPFPAQVKPVRNVSPTPSATNPAQTQTTTLNGRRVRIRCPISSRQPRQEVCYILTNSNALKFNH